MKENLWRKLGVESPSQINLRRVIGSLRSNSYSLPFPSEDSPHSTREWWDSLGAKGFRNAMATLLIEQIWDDHVKIVENKSDFPSLRLKFREDGVSWLDPKGVLPSELDSFAVARELGDTNEAVLNHLITQFVIQKKPLAISNDPEFNRVYWDLFGAITLCGIQNGCFTRKVPESVDSRVAYLARGVRVIKIVFDLPNLITKKTREFLQLSPEQHRNAVFVNVRTLIAESYLPTLPVFEVFGRLTTDLTNYEFLPEAYLSNEDPNNYKLYPDIDRLSSVMSQLWSSSQLPPETHCPFFSGKTKVLSLPRALELTLFNQLDKWFYPKYGQEVRQHAKN